MFERRGQFLSWAMEILDPMCAFLSNYEVLSLLIEQKNDRAKVTGFNLYSASKENVQTVEFEVC